MQTTHHTVCRHGFIVLHEVDSMPKYGSNLFIKLSLREALEEIALGVFKYAWLNDEHAGDICFITSIFKYYYFTSTRLACI